MKNRTSPRGGGLSCVLGLHVFSMVYTSFRRLPCPGRNQRDGGLHHWCFGRSRTVLQNRGHRSSTHRDSVKTLLTDSRPALLPKILSSKSRISDFALRLSGRHPMSLLGGR